MLPVLSREQIRAFDRHAIETACVPSVVLMENAGRGATDAIVELLDEASLNPAEPASCCILCGPGNNGGDGFVVARQLALEGVDVRTFLVVDPEELTGDANVQYEAWIGVGGSCARVQDEASLALLREAIADCDLIVDALLGTGLTRAINGLMLAIVEAVNLVGTPCVALDIPSGLDADTGMPPGGGSAIRAVSTVTFAHPTLGLVSGASADYVGELAVTHIGVPTELWSAVGASAFIVERTDVGLRLPARRQDVHKRSVGKVLVFAGSPGKTGAAVLVARGAHRAGAGLVTIAARPDVADALDGKVIETMTARLDPSDISGSVIALLADADAVVLGPGLGLDEAAGSLCAAVLSAWKGPIVMDADAITHYAGRVGELRDCAAQIVLTPHAGEMARLLGCTFEEIDADRFSAVRLCAEQSGAVALLKGPRTLIAAPGELPLVNSTGTSVLATGGSGDVLSGVIGALACGAEPRWAGALGAWIHGRAGELWAGAHGDADRGLLAGEIADFVPDAIAEAQRG